MHGVHSQLQAASGCVPPGHSRMHGASGCVPTRTQPDARCRSRDAGCIRLCISPYTAGCTVQKRRCRLHPVVYHPYTAGCTVQKPGCSPQMSGCKAQRPSCRPKPSGCGSDTSVCEAQTARTGSSRRGRSPLLRPFHDTFACQSQIATDREKSFRFLTMRRAES